MNRNGRENPLQSNLHFPPVRKPMYSRFLITLASIFWLNLAHAGVDESFKAFYAKDYATALTEAQKAIRENDPRGYYILGVMHAGGNGVKADSRQAVEFFEKAAKAGIVGAYSKLALAHLRGDGAPRDLEKVLSYGRIAANSNDAEGMFLVYVALTTSALGSLDASGRPNEEKYKALAARPVSAREVDMEARDWLYRSADKGYPLAMATLAGALGGILGDGNRKKMLALIEKLPPNGIEALKNYAKVARDLDSFGESYASPQLFADAQNAQMTTAILKACGLNPTKEQLAEAPPKIVSVAISKPVADAVYLPSKVAGYERAFLIAGSWEEEWTYKACGNTVPVTTKFKADGMGGARHESMPTLSGPRESK
jgi:TPR repeat protein